MNRRAAITAIAALLIALTAAPQRRATTRRQLSPQQSRLTTVTSVPSPFDTVACPDSAVAVSGYDKPARSTRESAFFTNATTRSIAGLIIRLTYTDTSGRTLHSVRRLLRADIVPGATRQLYWPSWDRQQSFHYRLSRPARAASSTPYDVSCRVDSLILAP